MSTKHEGITLIDSRDTLNSLKIASDLTSSARDRLVRVSVSDGKSPAVVLTKPRESFDTKAFAEAHPDLHKQFIKSTPPKARSLRITLPKEEP